MFFSSSTTATSSPRGSFTLAECHAAAESPKARHTFATIRPGNSTAPPRQLPAGKVSLSWRCRHDSRKFSKIRVSFRRVPVDPVAGGARQGPDAARSRPARAHRPGEVRKPADRDRSARGVSSGAGPRNRRRNSRDGHRRASDRPAALRQHRRRLRRRRLRLPAPGERGRGPDAPDDRRACHRGGNPRTPRGEAGLRAGEVGREEGLPPRTGASQHLHRVGRLDRSERGGRDRDRVPGDGPLRRGEVSSAISDGCRAALHPRRGGRRRQPRHGLGGEHGPGRGRRPHHAGGHAPGRDARQPDAPARGARGGRQAAPIGDVSYAVTVAEEALAADRDFELNWEPDLGDRPKPAVFAENLDGQVYAILVVLPPDGAAVPGARLPRETIFVIDTSGSMYGPSIDQARRSLVFALDRLHPEDRFNIIEFNHVMRRLYGESRRALSETVGEAKDWVGRLQANGGTEMLPALRAALEGAAQGSEVRQVVFVTDGGVGNEEELFRYIHDHLGRSRLFTVGIGSAPHSHFMTKAAEFGRGTFTYVGSPGEVDEKMGGLFRKLESPVLTDVRVEWDDPAVEAWPEKIPDLYAGEPLLVAARLSSSAGSVRVSGERAGARWNERVPVRLSSDQRGVDRLWARRKIAALMDR